MADYDYDDDQATLQRVTDELRRKYLDPALPPEPECVRAGGLLSGPRTQAEYEQMLKELDEAAEDVDLET